MNSLQRGGNEDGVGRLCTIDFKYIPVSGLCFTYMAGLAGDKNMVVAVIAIQAILRAVCVYTQPPFAFLSRQTTISWYYAKCWPDMSVSGKAKLSRDY